MYGCRTCSMAFSLVVPVLACSVSHAWADEPNPIQLSHVPQGGTSAEHAPATAPADEKVEESLPVSISLSYGLYTDYVFRGINFSEYPGERREKLNHQFEVSIGLDLSVLGYGDLGTIGFDTWFQWFAGQRKLDPDRDSYLQEVDYTIWWSRTIAQIATDLTLGFTYYQLLSTFDDDTCEYFIKLEHNDAWMWRKLWPDNEKGVLNPSFFLAHDVGTLGGVWMEFGVSHDFAVPGIEHLTVTPGYELAVQCNYWRDGFFIAGDTWSLVTAYDLTELLRLPAWAGRLGIAGELYYFNAYSNFRKPDGGADELWGGLSVTWDWGG